MLKIRKDLKNDKTILLSSLFTIFVNYFVKFEDEKNSDG